MPASSATRAQLTRAFGPFGGLAAANEIANGLGIFTTGTVRYVGSTSANAGDVATRDGTDSAYPFATLDYAIGRCTASVGDVIILMPGHAETTTAIAADVAGISIVGLGYGRNRPALTATTASTDLLNITAANIYIDNIRFVGAASGCTALLDIASTDSRIINCVFEHGAAPLAAITVQGSSHRFVIEDCKFFGTAAGPDYSIHIEAGAGLTTDNWRVEKCYANYGGSTGLDNAFLALNVSGTGYVIKDVTIVAFDTVAIDINSSTLAIGDGTLTGWAAASQAVTWANAVDIGGCIPMAFYVSDDPASRGKLWPTQTPT